MALPIKQIDHTMPSIFKSKPNTESKSIQTGNDRVLSLKPMTGGAKNTDGNTNNSLFNANTQLHAIMDEQTTLWHLKQSQGSVEPRLRDKQWTSFKMLLNDVSTYYKNRNVEVTEYAQ